MTSLQRHFHEQTSLLHIHEGCGGAALATIGTAHPSACKCLRPLNPMQHAMVILPHSYLFAVLLEDGNVLAEALVASRRAVGARNLGAAKAKLLRNVRTCRCAVHWETVLGLAAEQCISAMSGIQIRDETQCRIKRSITASCMQTCESKQRCGAYTGCPWMWPRRSQSARSTALIACNDEKSERSRHKGE